MPEAAAAASVAAAASLRRLTEVRKDGSMYSQAAVSRASSSWSGLSLTASPGKRGALQGRLLSAKSSAVTGAEPELDLPLDQSCWASGCRVFLGELCSP